MSACKSQKPELIAIYRLEFYKKQKNWKLSSSRKEKKPPQKPLESKKDLNITYNVNHPDLEDQSDPLNVAFVDSDSEKTTQTKLKIQTDIKKELSREWQEPVNIWPKTESCPPWSKHDENITRKLHTKNNNLEPKIPETPKPCAQKRLDDLQKAANSELTEEPYLDPLEDYCQESLEFNTWIDRNVWDKQCYKDWELETGDVLTEHLGQDVWTQAPQIDAIDGIDYAVDVLNPDPGFFGDGLWTEDGAEWSVDSEGEFQRGAHAAPHSSETELALPPCVNAPDVSFSSLSRLSSSQLLLAARQHSRVLRRLLQESEHRQKLRNAASLNSFSGSSFEEFPTRDVGFGNSSFNRNIFFKDVFITGSYKNIGVEGRGRGRGRLTENPLWR